MKKAQIFDTLVKAILALLAIMIVVGIIYYLILPAGKTAEIISDYKECPDSSKKMGQYLKEISRSAARKNAGGLDDATLIIGEEGKSGIYFEEYLPCRNDILEDRYPDVVKELEPELIRCVQAAYLNYISDLNNKEKENDPVLAKKVKKVYNNNFDKAPKDAPPCRYIKGDPRYNK